MKRLHIAFLVIFTALSILSLVNNKEAEFNGDCAYQPKWAETELYSQREALLNMEQAPDGSFYWASNQGLYHDDGYTTLKLLDHRCIQPLYDENGQLWVFRNVENDPERNTRYELYRAEDAVNFHRVPLPGYLHQHAYAIDYKNNFIYVITSGRGRYSPRLYRVSYDDEKQTEDIVIDYMGIPSSLVVSDEGVVYAALPGKGIFSSTNFGLNWYRLDDIGWWKGGNSATIGYFGYQRGHFVLSLKSGPFAETETIYISSTGSEWQPLTLTLCNENYDNAGAFDLSSTGHLLAYDKTKRTALIIEDYGQGPISAFIQPYDRSDIAVAIMHFNAKQGILYLAINEIYTITESYSRFPGARPVEIHHYGQRNGRILICSTKTLKR